MIGKEAHQVICRESVRKGIILKGANFWRGDVINIQFTKCMPKTPPEILQIKVHDFILPCVS